MHTAPAQAPDNSNPDVAAILQIARDFAQAVERGDIAKLMSFYSAEIVKSAPGQAPQSGKSAVEESWRKTLSQYDCRVDVQLDDVKILGEIAYDSGTFVLSLAPKGGGSVITSAGRVFEVIRKEGGAWKSVRVLSMPEKAR